MIFNDLIDKPVVLQGKDGISPEAPAFVSTTIYESNALAILDYEVENLGDPENGTAWENIASFPLTVTVTIPNKKNHKVSIREWLANSIAVRLDSDLLR
jgi:hypothetical protein